MPHVCERKLLGGSRSGSSRRTCEECLPNEVRPEDSLCDREIREVLKNASWVEGADLFRHWLPQIPTREMWRKQGHASLTVIIHEARGLLARDINLLHANTSDPYVIIGVEGVEMCTSIVKKNLNPNFEELDGGTCEFEFQLHEPVNSLELTVKDYDLATRDDLLGHASLNVFSLLSRTRHEISGWVALESPYLEGFRPAGAIRVSIQLRPYYSERIGDFFACCEGPTVALRESKTVEKCEIFNVRQFYEDHLNFLDFLVFRFILPLAHQILIVISWRNHTLSSKCLAFCVTYFFLLRTTPHIVTSAAFFAFLFSILVLSTRDQQDTEEKKGESSEPSSIEYIHHTKRARLKARLRKIGKRDEAKVEEFVKKVKIPLANKIVASKLLAGNFLTAQLSKDEIKAIALLAAAMALTVEFMGYLKQLYILLFTDPQVRIGFLIFLWSFVLGLQFVVCPHPALLAVLACLFLLILLLPVAQPFLSILLGVLRFSIREIQTLAINKLQPEQQVCRTLDISNLADSRRKLDDRQKDLQRKRKKQRDSFENTPLNILLRLALRLEIGLNRAWLLLWEIQVLIYRGTEVLPYFPAAIRNLLGSFEQE